MGATDMKIKPLYIVVKHSVAGHTVKLGPYRSSYSMNVITTALHKLGISYSLEDAEK